MGFIALGIALAAALCAMLPHPGMYLAMALGIFAVGAGVIGYRDRRARGAARLCAAGGITLALMALMVAGARYWVTLEVIDRIEQML